MKFCIIDTWYGAYLDQVYATTPGLHRRSYDEQWRILMDGCFGTADYYSCHLNRLGHEAREIIPNCRSLQQAWAREHGGLSLRTQVQQLVHCLGNRAGQSVCVPFLRDVLKAQITYYRPDILYVQDMNTISADLLQWARTRVRYIIGQTAYPLFPSVNLRGYDLLLTSFPHYVKEFSQKGLRSRYFRLGFEPRILDRLPRAKVREGVLFAGGLSAVHKDRIALLEQVARACPLAAWGYGFDVLPPDSALRSVYRGPAWGLQMYSLLQGAAVTLNHHIGTAGPYANNMRLYESTGMGTLLVTDSKENLTALFKPDEEVVTYANTDECIEKINWALTNEKEARLIAERGQARTLSEHTYALRIEELCGFIKELKRDGNTP